jgi:hypothetical protein
MIIALGFRGLGEKWVAIFMPVSIASITRTTLNGIIIGTRTRKLGNHAQLTATTACSAVLGGVGNTIAPTVFGGAEIGAKI